MSEVERLKYEHWLLSATLTAIEHTLQAGPSAWTMLRDDCACLSRQLHTHMRHEEQAVLTHRRAMTPVVMAELAQEHHDEPAQLKTVNRLFRETQALERIKPELTGVIQGLRRHMAAEERDLFPLLERGGA